MAWISWEKVLASKKYGGLGVFRFFAFNRALLFKWVWHFISQSSTMWTRTIKAIHGEKGTLGSLDTRPRRSPWLEIVREINILWSKEASGEYSVKSARSLIDDSYLPKEDVHTRWVKVVLLKINVFS
ncbi:hypothetical protein Tco_0675129 [Tanacetum coccineum]